MNELKTTLKPELKDKTKEKLEFKAAVGLSRKWDAYEAGKEVAMNSVEKLGSTPNVAILLSSYHYATTGGFEKLLAGIWSVLPTNTQLVGGVVSGFIVPEGCFIRGCALALLHVDNADVVVGVGNNTKSNPKKAAQECAHQIKEKLKNSNYEKGIIFEFTSGPFLPKIPIIGKRKVINSSLLGMIISNSQNILSKFQWGMGREEDVREEFTKQLSTFKSIGNTTWDASRFSDHRQFLNKTVYKNAIVALAIKSDYDFYLKTGLGFEKTNKTFTVTKLSGFGNIISEINGKPAREEYVRIQGWDSKDINELLIRRTYFVLPAYEKGTSLFPEVIGMVYGNDITVSRRVENTNMFMLTASGRSLVGAIDDAFKDFKQSPKFTFISSCHARLEALGAKVYLSKEKIEKYLGDTPYLLGFGGGECIYSQEIGCRHLHESFNIGVIN